MAGGEFAEGLDAVLGEEGGGVAGVENFRMEAGGGNCIYRGCKLMELLAGGRGVELIGGVEVGHDGFEAEPGRVFEELEDLIEGVAGGNTLAGHAGVDFEMDGDGLGGEVGPAGLHGEGFEVEWLPDDGREAVGEDGFGFAVPEAGEDEDARSGAEGANGDGFFDGGDAEPFGAFGGEPGGAEVEAVAVGVGLDDGGDGDGWSGKRAKGAVVVEQAGAGDLSPDGTGEGGLHVSIVYYGGRF